MRDRQTETNKSPNNFVVRGIVKQYHNMKKKKEKNDNQHLFHSSTNQASIGPDNGSLPVQHQAIIWTNADLWSIGPLETNTSEIFIDMSSFKKIQLKTLSAKWQSFCLGLNSLN